MAASKASSSIGFATPTAEKQQRKPAPMGWGYDWRGELVDLRGMRPGEGGRPAVFEAPKGKEE